MPEVDESQSYRVNLTEGGVLSLRVCLNRSEWVHLYVSFFCKSNETPH